MSHISKSHVTHEWAMSHMNESRVTWHMNAEPNFMPITPRILDPVTHMNKSWVMSRMIKSWVMSRMNESWVMSRMNESWVMSDINEPWVMSHIKDVPNFIPMRPRILHFVTHMNKPCHVWMSHGSCHVWRSHGSCHIWMKCLTLSPSAPETSFCHAYMNEPWGMSHMNESWFMSHMNEVPNFIPISPRVLHSVTHTNKSCRTYAWVTSHMNESRRTSMSHESCHVWMSHESRHTYECWHTLSPSAPESFIPSHIQISHVAHMHQSRHIWMSHVAHQWVMSHVTYEWVMRRGTHMNVDTPCPHQPQSPAFRHTYDQATPHLCMSHVTYEWVMSRMNESWVKSHI